MTRNDFCIGDTVRFGRIHGEQTVGTIVKLNPTKAKVRTLESRGNGRGARAGAEWGVPYSMMTKASTAPAPAPTMGVGQSVMVMAYNFATHGEAPCHGVITKVASSGYEVDYCGAGSTRMFPFDQVTKTGRRSEAAIMNAILGVYCGLSPENLHCDGEISRSAARAKAVVLNRVLRALELELGRKVTESQAYAYEKANSKRG